MNEMHKNATVNTLIHLDCTTKVVSDLPTSCGDKSIYMGRTKGKKKG